MVLAPFFTPQKNQKNRDARPQSQASGLLSQGFQRLEPHGREGGDEAAQQAHRQCEDEAQEERLQVDREAEHDELSAAPLRR